MPQKKSREQKETVTAYIGVGSNIAPDENIPKALELLVEHTCVCDTSTFYRTEPLENRRQPEYRNGVWRIETSYSPHTLKKEILATIERILKRKRTKDKYAPRTIDLDLLLYGDLMLDDDEITIPDPDIYRRQFLAAGIFELAPGLRLPGTKTGIKTVLERLNLAPLRPDTALTNKLAAVLAESSGNIKRQADLWRMEYETLRGINLSYRDREPEPVAIFRSLIKEGKIQSPAKILDIGCGKGRIGIHLAYAGFEVTGFDIVPSAVREFLRIAKEKALYGKIKAVIGDLNAPWKIPDRSFDCAFAITVIDNLTSLRARKHFLRELLRILSPDGLFVLECYSGKDGYYGSILKKSRRKSGIVLDPNNKMRFRIYSNSELAAFFSPHFKLVHHETAVWNCVKYNRSYKRNSGIWIFQKK